ncbi:glycosyltransferase [Cohnella cellulosilytica]|uniref:Glycosyltransferase n=1 Tax=Cohnella cellulosilytica TaxID=986710 RepID=A0ABW2F4N8_9BACL
MSEPGVSIITCTNRPEFFANILSNYRNQRYERKELIIVVNKDSIRLREWRSTTAADPHVTVYQVPERISLGQCLNCGASRAKYSLLAKFDHDDYYSPYYLREQVRALLRTGSPVAGKHACLVYLEASNRLIIRSPREKNKRVRFIQGGTLLFRKEVLNHVRFPDLSLGEDVRFLRGCAKKGYAIHATSPYNYVYIRRKNKSTHTWKASDRRFLIGSQPVAVTKRYRRFAVRKL